MSYLTAFMGTVLLRTILVGSVLVSMKFVAEGLFILAASLAVPLLFFLYLSVGDAALFR